MLIAAIFSVPVYNNWFFDKILNENFSMTDQMQHMGMEDRMLLRYGMPYDVYKMVTKTIRESKDPNPIILIPTNSYLTAINANPDFQVAEPAVFYYFTGIKGVMATSPDANKANWVLVPEGDQIIARAIKSKDELNAFLELYKKYPL